MPTIQPVVLRAELMETYREIQRQIDEVKLEAAEMEVPAHKLRDSAGNWIMVSLLTGKAQVLNALTLLNTKES